ncbi:MAG: hypothetical protein ACJAT2_002486 [Bacteriovoracaceae bacterium]|jgi:hypothetical protein
MKILICLLYLISFQLYSTETPKIKDIHLSTISTNYVDKTYSLLIGVDENNTIQYVKTINNKKNKVKIYQNELLKNNLPLVKAAGVELVTLRCEEFDPSKGCPITIRYPINILVMAFKSFKAEIKKDSNGEWGLYMGPKRFTKMKLIARKVLGLLIGVDRIEVS